MGSLVSKKRQFSVLLSPLELSVNRVMKVKLDVIERKPGEQEQAQTWMTSDIWTESDY